MASFTRRMNMDKSIAEIFLKERTCYNFDSNKPVSQSLLKEIYDIMKMGPTSANCSPLRMVFVESKLEKDRLLSCVMDGNVNNIQSAPMTVIFAYDLKFYEKMDKLFAHNPNMKSFFSGSESVAVDTAIRNSTLQAAYFMIVARSKGLALAPMSGFDSAKINKEFFNDSGLRVNFISSLGYRSQEEVYLRLPRLDFDEVCKIV